MSFRMYVDEVGNDDITHTDDDNHRFLSLTGVAMKISHARDYLEPQFNSIKTDIFDHDPDTPVIFHRTDIVQKKKHFYVLGDLEKRNAFDARVIGVMNECEYAVITAFIDKRAMLRQQNWSNKHPYNYLMEILVEKYTQFLERKNDVGDIMPEARQGKKDRQLQEAFCNVRNHGTYYVPSARINKRLPAHNLKFRQKKDNIAGLQLCDLVAHPSHMHIRKIQGHDGITPGTFCKKVLAILNAAKYDRSHLGKIVGYGIKWLP